jgi:SEC-C motif-containing protein
MRRAKTPASPACPCGAPDYAACCGRYHGGAPAASAQELMRSRYSAYVLRDEAYLQATWHPATRPASAVLEDGDGVKWLGLEVLRHAQDGAHATVEFVARYKLGGRARRLHEISRFEQVDGRWLYVDGGFPSEQEG